MKLTYESENLFAKTAWRNPENPNDYQLEIQITSETFERILNLVSTGLCGEDYEENEELFSDRNVFPAGCIKKITKIEIWE